MSVSSMKRLTVFAFRADSDKLLRKLMHLRCVEIKSVALSDGELALKRAQSEAQVAQAEKELAEIRAVLPLLTKYSTRKNGLGKSLHEFDPEAFAKNGSREQARRTVADALEIAERIKQIHAEIADLKETGDACMPWVDYDAPLSETKTRFTVTCLCSCPKGVKEEQAMERLAAADAYVEPISEDKNNRYYAVTCHRERESDVNTALASMGFLKAEPSERELPAQKVILQCEERQARLEEELMQQEERLRDLAEALEQVEILCDVTDTERTLALTYRSMAQTGACTLLEGWIPTLVQDAVEEVLKKFECAYELEEPAEGEEPPVLLRNNKFAQNFEWVVGMYSYPQYGRYDPTLVMSIFYFLIFGLMFADVGYGLVLTLGSLAWIKFLKPRPNMRRMLSMFAYCGISAIVMGVIFGGWFGDLPTAFMQNVLGLPIDTSVGHFFGSGLWFNPLDDPIVFLVITVALGLVHLVAGMAVKFYILCKDKQVGEAVCTILPYWVLFAGIILTILVGTKVGLITAGVGAGMILLLNGYGIRNPIKRLIKGLGGLYGIISYASDLLSYSRILALALVAAVIAKVVNMITLSASAGVGGIVLMVVVLIIGHILNLALNVLGAFVHTARLQYLEFFGKFYEDGGRAFEPITPSEQYSEPTEL